MRTSILGALFATALLLVPADSAEERKEVRFYPLDTGEPAAIQQVIKELIGDAGNVVWNAGSSRFIVVAPEEKQKLVAEALKGLDTRVRNVQIEVRTMTSSTQRDTEIGAEVSGRAVVSKAERDGTVHVKPQVKDQSSKRDAMNSTMVTVTSGHEASMLNTRSVPFVDWIFDYGRNWGYVEATTVWRDVGAKLWVCPTIIGDGPMIRIKLIPELSHLVKGKWQTVRYTRVDTELTVRDGQTVSFAGVGENADFYKRFLAGFAGSSKATSTSITLTPRIMQPGSASASR